MSYCYIYRSKLTCSLGPVDQGFADLPNGEHGRGLNIVPVLAGEGIDAEKRKRKNYLTRSHDGTE